MEKGIRCDVISNELQNKIEFTENIEGIDEWPHSWPDGEISYRLNNFSDDFNKRWQTRAVTVALRTWKLRIKNIYFRRERNPDAHVDFNVSWEKLAHFDGRKGVLAHVLGQGLTLSLAGVMLGVVGALGTVRVLSSFLFGVQKGDPLTWASVSGLMIMAAVLGAGLPALRATRVSPTVALRAE